MLYRRLADLVVVVHVLSAGFFFLGGVLAIFHPWLAWFHLPLALWVSSAFIMGWTCPLTPLENHLRRAAGQQGYAGSFVDHYLAPLLRFQPSAHNGPPPSPEKLRRHEVLLGIIFCILTLLPYALNYPVFLPGLRPQAPSLTR